MTRTLLPSLSCRRYSDTGFIVRNLAPGVDGALSPQPVPESSHMLPGTRPVAIKHSPRLGTRLFMLSGRNLSVTDSSGSVPVGTLHGDFLSVADTGSRLVFMTSEGPWTVDYDLATDNVSVRGNTPLYPSIAFHASAVTASESTVRPVTFKGTYTHWAGPLDPLDADALTGEMRGAVDRCFAAALAEGRYPAPVLVWYHLLDAAGSVVHRSSPVLVEPEPAAGRLSCEIPVSRSGSAYAATSPSALSLPSFTLNVVVPAAEASAWGDAVTVKVFRSRPLPEVDVTAPFAATFAGTSSSPVLRLSVPPFRRYDSVVTGFLDTLREEDCDTFVINLDPGSGAARRVALPPGNATSMTAAVADMRTAARRIPSTDVLAGVAPPHSFSAAASCVDGDMTVWGDITPLSALPQGVSAWATAVASAEPWSAVVRVTIATDTGEPEILSLEESGAGNAPLQLSRLISYPHPSARLIEIEITRPSGVTRLSLPLTPYGSVAAAMNRGTSSTGDTLSAGATPLKPVTRRRRRRQRGLMLTALSSSPLTPLSALTATSGTIVAVTPASRSSSAWDFARRHLYLFGSGGIHAVAVSSAMKSVSAHLIDSRAVTAAAHVARSPDGVYALSAGNLLLVKGSRAELVDDRVTAGRIGWSGADGSLYCTSGVAAVTVRSPDGSWHTRELPGTSEYAMTGDGNRLVVYSGSRFITLPSARAESAAVYWKRRLMLARGGVPQAIRCVEVHMSSPAARLTIGLYGDNGSAVTRLITSVDVEGEITAPVVLPVIFPCPFIYFSLKIEGSLAPGSLITAVKLIH